MTLDSWVSETDSLWLAARSWLLRSGIWITFCVMSQPFSLSTAAFLTSTGTSAIVVDAASESLPNAADASPKMVGVLVELLLYSFRKRKRSRKPLWFQSSRSRKGCFQTRWNFLIREFCWSNCSAASAGIDRLFYFCRGHSVLMLILPASR